MQRTKWIDRTFTFDFPSGWLANIMERLRGTPARILEMTRSLSDEEARNQPNGKWSIKEQVGHLCDLEPLHIGRMDDFIARKDILRAADMSNAITYEEKHNQKDLQQLISEFKKRRDEFITKIENLDEATMNSKSIHPRLKVLVRPIDIAYFTAEHDDHHLADIREILKKQK
ncbi:MAG: DinB family protein [Bacteroidia bacterium]